MLEVKFVSSLYTFTWTKLELSVKSNQLSWRHYSATHAVPPYVCCGLLLRKALYHVSLKLLHKRQFSATHAQYIRVFFQLLLLKVLNILLITITTQARCFRNSQKTSQWSLSAAANSAVKSRFLAICTNSPLLSKFQSTSRWTLLTAALRGV